MSTKAVQVAVAVATGLLCGCAATPHPLEIGVREDSFVVEGQTLKTRDALAEAIRSSGVTECRVKPGATSDYKRVELAVLAMRDSGCRSGIVGIASP
jgi:hypothetical protein